ncbi:response regulator [Pseudomonas gregormendelii]|uniref:Response regulator n=1 Tax=Pseudomonas gregormendelii TaxID=1628277 RepID=A0ABS3APH0_9PSED|nr:response regulator [Pseudomonas gregormendelii]MBN3968777.1 response regulator [Pseudomonas gregormendelii]
MTRIPIISIVDDDKSGRIALSSLMRSLGYESHLFSCAEDFLASTERNVTDCLITDVQMPGMSGLDLQRELCNHSPDVPIIFITAHPEESVRQRAKAGGAVCFLSKPFDGQVLIDCIERTLANARAHSARM